MGLPTEPHVWLAALAVALPITFFFYMDQNISSLLCQLPEMHLARARLTGWAPGHTTMTNLNDFIQLKCTIIDES